MPEYVQFNKDDVLVYSGFMPYHLSNGQIVEKEGQELILKNDVKVQKRFFELKNKNEQKENDDLKVNLENNKDKVELENDVEPNNTDNTQEDENKSLDEMNKEELLEFAGKNDLEVDKRKGEDKLRAFIKENLEK